MEEMGVAYGQAQFLPVRKKDYTLRSCMGYHGLNANSDKERYSYFRG